MTVTLQGFHPEVAAIIQQNTLVRAFYDVLFPQLLFRADVGAERWEANIGDVKIFTRSGQMTKVTKPLTPGQDPIARSYSTEQWRVEASQYGDRLQTHMPTSRAAIASKFAEDGQKLAEGAGLSTNGFVRDRLYTAYLSGDTVNLALVNSGGNTIRVANLNGFLDTIVLGRITSVSPVAPIAIELDTTRIPNTVIAAIPDDLTEPTGPGTITLGTVLGANLPARAPVRARQRARILRVGGGVSVDGITASNVLTVGAIIQAIQYLRSQNVPPHADGRYHVHLPSEGVAQMFEDNQWQRLYQSIPDSAPYRNVMIGATLGSYFYDNNQCPSPLNVGLLRQTGTVARESDSIGAEVINQNGIPIGRTIITGGDCIKEHYIPETEYTTEGGVNGKIGSFQATNNGVQVLTDRIRYIIRAPQDVLQQIYDQAWSFSGDWAVPTDLLSGNGARYKRAVVVEHAGTGL